MKTDYYEYSIAEHWVSAIENGDYSGLTDKEEKELGLFLDSLPRDYIGWDWSEDASFKEDEVSGLMANCAVGKLYVRGTR